LSGNAADGKKSEEGDAEGFGWFDANVIRFRVTDTIKFKILIWVGTI